MREAGHRVTPQRLAVLNILKANRTFLDAEQIYELTAQETDDTSLATIYRTLQLFVELGLVEARYLDPEHKREYYRLAGGLEYHYMTCRGCGKMVPIDPEIVHDVALAWANSHGLTLLTAHACYTGFCQDCTAKRANHQKAE
ncbi:MAG: Fur family transcriptional regulator [Anaerolineae bacterium]